LGYLLLTKQYLWRKSYLNAPHAPGFETNKRIENKERQQIQKTKSSSNSTSSHLSRIAPKEIKITTYEKIPHQQEFPQNIEFYHGVL
jgi:hypothetical protein